MFFPYIGNNNPIRLYSTHIFQRGRYTTNQPICCLCQILSFRVVVCHEAAPVPFRGAFEHRRHGRSATLSFRRKVVTGEWQSALNDGYGMLLQDGGFLK